MKNALRLLAVIALAAALFAPPVLAQDATAQDNEARAAQYQKFIELYKGAPEQQKQAYDIAKEYVTKYGSLTDESDVKILNFLKDYVTKYERADLDHKFTVAVQQLNFNETVALGRRKLVEEPDSVRLHLTIARTGFLAVNKGNKAAAPEALNFIRRTAQLIESGKTATDWSPFTGKEDTLGWLSYMEGVLLYDTQPDAAAKSLLKAAQATASAASKEPSTYDTLAFLYRKEFQKAAAEYQQKFPEGTEITPERKPEYDRLQAQLDRIKDRIIDAQARIVVLSTKPEQQAEKNKVMAQLVAVYKSRHDSEAGLKELLAGVLSKPVMVPGQEPTPMPAAVPTTNTPGTTPTTGTSPQASQTGKPAASTPTTTTTQPRPAPANTGTTQPKPASSTPRP